MGEICHCRKSNVKEKPEKSLFPKVCTSTQNSTYHSIVQIHVELF